MNGLLTVPSQSLKYRPACRISKGLENVICDDRHAETIAKWLWIVKHKNKHSPSSEFSSLPAAAKASSSCISPSRSRLRLKP
jgi:hypothetical protein